MDSPIYDSGILGSADWLFECNQVRRPTSVMKQGHARCPEEGRSFSQDGRSVDTSRSNGVSRELAGGLHLANFSSFIARCML